MGASTASPGRGTRPFTAPAALVLLALFLAAVSLAACGGSPSRRAAEPRATLLSHARQATIDAGTTSLLFELQLHGVKVHGAPPGALALLSSPNEHLGGEGTFDLGSSRGFFTLDTPNFGPLEILVIGETFYVEFPPSLVGPLKATPWMSIGMATLARVHSASLAALSQLFAAMDPALALEFLRGLSGPIQVIGHQRIYGVPTTEIRTSIDLNLAASRTPGDARALVEQTTNVLHLTKLPIDLWVDPEGRIRKSRFSVSLDGVSFPVPGNPLEAETLSGSVTVTHELTAFTTKQIAAVPPPKAEVTALSALIARAGL